MGGLLWCAAHLYPHQGKFHGPLFRREGYELASDCMMLPIVKISFCFLEELQGWKLQPDWETLLVCGYNTSHASVMCRAAQSGLEDPLEKCPRSSLSEALNAAQETYELEMEFGFTMEFLFLTKTTRIQHL